MWSRRARRERRPDRRSPGAGPAGLGRSPVGTGRHPGEQCRHGPVEQRGTLQRSGSDLAAGLATVPLAQPDQRFPAHPRPAAGHARARLRRIVNVASTTGTRGSNPGEAAYSAAKAGLVGWSMALALEVAKSGITVNSVAPGWIATGSSTAEERQAALASPADVPAGPKWPPRWPSSPRPKPASSTANCWWWTAATA